jgi:hypothetical protein
MMIDFWKNTPSRKQVKAQSRIKVSTWEYLSPHIDVNQQSIAKTLHRQTFFLANYSAYDIK